MIIEEPLKPCSNYPSKRKWRVKSHRSCLSRGPLYYFFDFFADEISERVSLDSQFDRIGASHMYVAL